jgi:hypothetical protein
VSDQRLRELERRFRATGDAQDEAAWLAERMRLEPGLESRLAAAACAGHPAARAVLALRPAVTTRLLEWTEALARHGQQVLVVATGAALQPIVSGSERGGVSDQDTRHALAVAAAWVVDPSPRTEALCAQAATAARTTANGLSWGAASRSRVSGASSRSIHERCLRIRLGIEAEGASSVVTLVRPPLRRPPERIAAHALVCAALVARGTATVFARAHELFLALRGSETTGPLLYDDVRDAAILERARRGVIDWAIGTGPLPLAPEVRAVKDGLLDGRLTHGQVTIAARAGAQVAAQVLGGEAPPREDDVRTLVEALARSGRDAHLRAALAAMTSLAGVEREPALMAVTEAAGAYLACPCGACAATVERSAAASGARAADLLTSCVGARDEAGTTRYAQATVRWCVLRQASLAAGLDVEATRALEASCLPGARRPAAPAHLAALRVSALDELFVVDGPIQAAVRGAIVAWALRDLRPSS